MADSSPRRAVSGLTSADARQIPVVKRSDCCGSEAAWHRRRTQRWAAVSDDAFHPRPGAAPFASPPPFTVNLVDNIRRLKPDVERVVHVHGGTDSLATVAKAAGL